MNHEMNIPVRVSNFLAKVVKRNKAAGNQFASMVKNSQIFFMPAGLKLKSTNTHLMLPFDQISVFISIPDGDGVLRDTLIVVKRVTDDEVQIWPAVNIGEVFALPPVNMTLEGDQIVFSRFNDKHPLSETMRKNPDFAKHLYPPAGAHLCNLLTMLSLGNVNPIRVEADAKESRKRVTFGKLPLYSYHVLEVSGERWESNGHDAGDGRGYRSHLRRGHIRRVDGRNVWVRSCFVRGKIDGFVDKDYSMLPVAEKVRAA